ncbi:MAG: 3-deoxy-manno-octulosonate cytidylyltransferase [Planctomycetes bacterium]|nr:3-deoxy-manno-octulosonate cytidylyltransferase [Planctomycetota bacterium]
MDVVAIIPARYGSTRFSGKALANQTGKPLIQHVCERVAAARCVRRCIVATDDERISVAVAAFGGEAVMTRPDHASGTDRIAEVVATLDGTATDIIVNVQGDEPEIDPADLDRLVERLSGDAVAPVATLAAPFPAGEDPRDPNCVKVVCDEAGRALYFSRALVPFPRGSVAEVADAVGWLLHVGVYAYRRDFLLELTGWGPSRLERIERLEQLRVLEHGRAIAVHVVERAWVGIDTPQDYAEFVRRWQMRRGG